MLDIIADTENNLHVAGVHDSSETGITKASYYYYDYEAEEWSYPIELTQDYTNRDLDIALDTNQLPHIAWNEGACFYTYFNGDQWVEKDTVNTVLPFSIEIEIDDKNDLHIITSENTNDGMDMVYYYKPDGVHWENMIVDQGNNVIFTPKLELYNNLLFLVYDKSDSVPYGDIYITKLDLLTSMSQNSKPENNYYESLRISPNPSSGSTTASYSLKYQANVSVKVFSHSGKIVKQITGTHQNIGENKIIFNTNGLSPGIYFCSLFINGRLRNVKKLVVR